MARQLLTRAGVNALALASLLAWPPAPVDPACEHFDRSRFGPLPTCMAPQDRLRIASASAPSQPAPTRVRAMVAPPAAVAASEPAVAPTSASPVDDRAALEALIDARIAAHAKAQAAAPPASDPRFSPRREAFTWADFSWIPGGYAPDESPLRAGPFTGELRLDAAFHYSLARPRDNTIGGSSEVFRHGELQLTQLGAGGNFFFRNVHARFMTQLGMYSVTTPRNDASPSRGNWRLDDAYRYISEAYAGYHIPVLHGINVQAGIFMSYVGLWSYYNFDNWTYQPSFVSSNTPWFFNGVRVQIFPTKKLKIEPWLVNGWQAYGRFNQAPGVGLQVLWRPRASVSVLGNQYVGADTLGQRHRRRIHSDDSVMVRWLERSRGFVRRAAASLTIDAGCETGGGVRCGQQYFLGFMAYQRLWFWRHHLGVTVGGGAITNPGRYLVLLPPINGATASSGTPYFTANPGNRYWAWDTQSTLDVMPNRFITVRLEFTHREASVPYFTGPGGVTPPSGNVGAPGSEVPGWRPDLAHRENRFTLAMLVRY